MILQWNVDLPAFPISINNFARLKGNLPGISGHSLNSVHYYD
jgi:hypothetical protein